MLEELQKESAERKRLARIKGQIEGIDRMLRDMRALPEVLPQIRAARQALAALENALLECHLREQLSAPMSVSAAQEKVEELMQLLRRS